MRRLRLLGYRPDRCLIPAREPGDETGHRGEAFRQSLDELMNDDFVWTEEHETVNVVDFARLPKSPVLKLA